MNLRKPRAKSTSIQPHSSVAKTQPLNTLSERELQKCDCTREQGTVAAWKRRKVAKMRLSNAAIVTKVYRDLHHCLQKASLHGKSGWSLGVCRGPYGTRLSSPVLGGTDSLVWKCGMLRFALYGESLGAVPSSGQPARRGLFSLCLVCMHV